jgi:hypothetical protein
VFNSTILDVAAGVIFGFLAVSLFTSAAVEAINSVFKLRSRGLVSGIKQLMNDPDFTGLAKTLYQHAAVNPRGPGGVAPLTNSPAYVDGMQFAGALLDITGLSAASATEAARAPGPQALDALKAQLTVSDPQLKQLLGGIIDRSGGDMQTIKSELAAWFDTGMDRVSGAFKRWTQLASFAIALLIAILVNVDSIRLATVLWEQPALADKLKASSALPSAVDGEPKTQEVAVSALTRILQADLPVGWAPGHFFEESDGHGGWQTITLPTFLWALFGWTVTAVAALFGAPFWFDTLQSIIRLKGSGPSPAEKKNNQAAAN